MYYLSVLPMGGPALFQNFFQMTLFLQALRVLYKVNPFSISSSVCFMLWCCNSLHILHSPWSEHWSFCSLPFFRNIWILDDSLPSSLTNPTCCAILVYMFSFLSEHHITSSKTVPPPHTHTHIHRNGCSTASPFILLSPILCDVVELRGEDAGLIDLVSQMCKCVNITYDQTHWTTVFLMITKDSRLCAFQPSCSTPLCTKSYT